MSDVPPRMEDFFQRVKDVSWAAEPKVYWVAGNGYPLFINGQSMGTNSAMIATSSDGLHWHGSEAGGLGGIGTIHGGAWMRVGLTSGASPVWVLVGSTSTGVAYTASLYSDDGGYPNVGSRVQYDYRHRGEHIEIDHMPYIDQDGRPQAGSVKFESAYLFPNWHRDVHRSNDGKQWQPELFHPASGSGSLVETDVQTEVKSRIIRPTGSSIMAIVEMERDPVLPLKELLLPRRSLTAPAVLTTPFADKPEDKPILVKKAADRVFIPGSTETAVGKIRKGPMAGQTFRVTIEPYHTFPEGGDHGDSTVTVTNLRTGEKFVSDTGIERSITIAYGHYVFAVGGGFFTGGFFGDAPAQSGLIACTEDLVNWAHNVMGDAQFNALAVGPRK